MKCWKLLGIEIPQEYGGTGSTFFNSILAIEEMAKVDSCIGGMVDLQNTVVNTLLLHNGSRQQLETYCPKLATHMVLYLYPLFISIAALFLITYHLIISLYLDFLAALVLLQ